MSSILIIGTNIINMRILHLFVLHSRNYSKIEDKFEYVEEELLNYLSTKDKK